MQMHGSKEFWVPVFHYGYASTKKRLIFYGLHKEIRTSVKKRIALILVHIIQQLTFLWRFDLMGANIIVSV
jgi:hypothetical protein